ncbi:MAG: hypothetical protein R2862_07820 [Thermoanaerobaculia bacterium]
MAGEGAGRRGERLADPREPGLQQGRDPGLRFVEELRKSYPGSASRRLPVLTDMRMVKKSGRDRRGAARDRRRGRGAEGGDAPGA